MSGESIWPKRDSMRQFGKCSVSWLWLNKSICTLKFMELYTRIFFLLNRFFFLRNCAEIKFLPCQISKNVKVWHSILVARLEEIGPFLCCWKVQISRSHIKGTLIASKKITYLFNIWCIYATSRDLLSRNISNNKNPYA